MRLTYRFYSNTEALLTTKRIELINKKKFAKAELDDNSETFMFIWLLSTQESTQIGRLR